MPNQVEINCRVRGTTLHDLYAANDDNQPDMNARGDLSVVQGLPPYSELTRLGMSWQVMTSAAVAPVVALPTTAAFLSLYNGETGRGAKSYIIDAVMGLVVVSAAAATHIGLLAMNNIAKNVSGTKPTAAALTIANMSGKNAYGGQGIVAVGTTVVNDGWFPTGTSTAGVASQIGQLQVDDVQGRFIVRPGGQFNVSVIANTVTTITVLCGVRWHEVLLDS